MSAHIRTLYEDLRNWQRSVPLTARRKNAIPGMFDSYKLRALRRFVLTTGKDGLTQEEQLDLFKLLDIWDGSYPGMPVDARQARGPRHSFPSPNSFTQAIKDDIDEAVRKAGWRKCVLLEDGVRYKTYFRPVLELVLALMCSTTGPPMRQGATAGTSATAGDVGPRRVVATPAAVVADGLATRDGGARGRPRCPARAT